MLDYLDQRKDVILENSYLNDFVDIPRSVHELSTFLPGRSHYYDVNELLIDIGKSRDVDFLRSKVSKIFLVPLTLLKTMDESRFSNITRTLYATQLSNNVKSSDKVRLSYGDVLNGGSGADFELAYSDNVCQACLPVRGDAIIGTKSMSADSPTTIVHRMECPYAQEVMNNVKSKSVTLKEFSNKNGAVEDPNSERTRIRSRPKLSSKNSLRPDSDEYPVQLVWPTLEDSWEDGNSETFLTEVVIVANDRKLLLADCGAVASRNSEILKTGSSSTSEHCILEFLVRVRDLDELQSLMDKLGEVDCVMSVERRVRTLTR
jgi:(p)ppGpp synthase/HD superfamily hydrolase